MGVIASRLVQMVPPSRVGVRITPSVCGMRTRGGPLHTLDGHTDWVNSLSFSPDGTTVASGSYDDTARLWDANTGGHSARSEDMRIGSGMYRLVQMAIPSQPRVVTEPSVSGM